LQEDRDQRGRFVKGTSGNPKGGGRPPVARSLSEAIRALGLEEYEPGKPRNYALAAGLWNMALKGESDKIKLAATREILDRTEGRPIQAVDVTSGGELIKAYPDSMMARAPKP
jgi:hypothetical protein